MQTEVEVLFGPVEFEALARRGARGRVCVVFDVLRATSSMVTALANGAAAVIPAVEISEALELKRGRPEALLAGERGGLRITKALTGSVDFDLGNSPREFVREVVVGREIIMTTTNGTRGLKACVGADAVLLGAFLNLSGVVRWILGRRAWPLTMVCSGTGEDTALEDVLGAGALVEALGEGLREESFGDAAVIAREVYRRHRHDLVGAVRLASNGRRLLSNPMLAGDVSVCLARDVHEGVGVYGADGRVVWESAGA